MNFFTQYKNLLVRALVSFCIVLPMFSSCSDIKELWGEVEDIKERLDSLELGLNEQIVALDALLAGGEITISTCKQNDNGSCSITLSDGTKFTVMPESAGKTPLLSFVVEGNDKYWAVYDSDGKLVPLTDGEGKKIPVRAATPVVKEKDGIYYLVIGDMEYPTGYKKDDNVSVITDYVVNADETGNIYSVTFKIGDETFTLSVDGYKGFTFMLGSSAIGGHVIRDLYVAHGSTYRVTAGLDGVIDYVMQIPDGWRVKETSDKITGELFLDITAPTKSTVASGAAVDSGDLKVVAVVEGGDAMVARLELSTTPFKTFKVTSTNAIISKYNGVEKFLYGISTVSGYDEAAIFAGADAMLRANDKGVSDVDIDKPLSEILGSELAADEKYVFWAVPAFYDAEDENAAYYVVEGLIFTQEFNGTYTTQELSDVTFNGATLNFFMSGVASYFGGTCEHTDAAVTEILFRINNGMEDPLTGPFTYTGSVFAFPDPETAGDIQIKSNVPYITWVIPYVEGKTDYGKEDMILKEFTLPEVTSGGQIEVVSGTAEVGKVSISVPLTAEGGSRIYYLYMTSRTANRQEDDAARVAYLLKNGNMYDGDSVTATVEKLSPGTTRVLFAMAVDASGKYGPVKVMEYTTDELVYNDIELTLNAINVGQDVASIGITASGSAVEYIYWAGKQTEEFWLDLSGSNSKEKAASAQEILALYPDNADVKKAMSSFPLSDGVLSMSGLKSNTVYQVVVIAKDADGNFSHAGHTQITTMSVNLGTIVTSDSQTWKDAKAKVEIDWHDDKFRSAANSNMSAYYAFDIKVPTDLTAYILCMTEEYFQENPDTQTLEDKIIDIEAQCSRKYDAGKVTYDENGEYALEPDWVDDNGNVHQGTLLNVYDSYVHGYPTNGFVTYFATGSHGADNCTEWEAGECTNYAYALQHINKRLTIDYYKSLFQQKGLKIQSVIDKAAQDLFEAYYPYYKDAKPLIYENTGEALYMEQHYASGPNEDGVVIDDVIVVFKDAQGNYYEPMFFEVPNSFR